MLTKPTMTDKHIPQTDCDQHLVMYCENRATSSINSNNRGVFVSRDSKTVVARGLPYPMECTTAKFNPRLYRVPFRTCRVTKSIEGPVIIVFHHKDQWYISTNRKLNAFKSYWADSTSRFGLTFAYGVFRKLAKTDLLKLQLADVGVIKKELDKVFDEYLDRSNRYIFIQPPTHHERLVTTPSDEHPIPIHVATFKYQDVTPAPGVDRLTKIDPKDVPKVAFANYPTVYDLRKSRNPYKYVCALANKIDPNKAQGILIEIPNGPFIKILNPEYHHRLRVRGDAPSLKHRYMQLRQFPETLNQLLIYYPEINSDTIEKRISETCSVLWTICLIIDSGVQPANIGAFLDNKGYRVESIELSKVLYFNLLHEKKFIDTIQEIVANSKRGIYETFQMLSMSDTCHFNKLADKIKVQTVKARRNHETITDTIQAEIEFLDSLDQV